MGIEDVAKLLSRTDAGSSLTDDERRRIAMAGRVNVAFDGATVIQEGSDARSMLLLVDGEVTVHATDGDGRERQIATLAPGSVLGESSLLTEGPRSATVRAKGSVRTFEIGRDSFEMLLEGQDPAAVKMLLSMARTLARRQRATNARLVDLLVRVGKIEGAPAEVSSCLEDLVIEWE